VVLFGTGIITARALGPENLGYTKFILLTVNTIAQFGSLGIIDATCYFQKKTAYGLERVYNANLTYLLAASVIYAGVMIALRTLGLSFEDYPTPIFIYMVSFIIGFGFLNDLLFATLVSKEKIIFLNNTDLILGIINLMILSVLWLTGHLNVGTYLILLPSMAAVRFTILSLYIRIRPVPVVDKKLLKQEFLYGFTVFFGALCIYLNYRMDQWFIKFFHGNKELGLYTVAVSIAEILLIIPVSIINPLRAKLYNTPVDSENFKTVTAKTIKFALYGTAFMSLPVLVLAPLISSRYLYGSDYSGSVLVTRILAAGIIFLTFGKIGSHYYNVKGQPSIPMKTSLTVFLINLSLNMLLIPRYGITGAAAASTASYIFYGIIFVYLYTFKEGFKFSDLFLIQKTSFIHFFQN
jgi:O-antigen/teichoic acid export membrane protein